MTIEGAIGHLDSLMHNTYRDHDKRRWLSTVDGMIKNQIIDTHEGAEAIAFAPYDDETKGDTALLAQPPFDAMYLHYLMAQIHYHNGEIDRYNNAVSMFQAAYDSFRNHYHRTHTPRGVSIRYR